MGWWPGAPSARRLWIACAGQERAKARVRPALEAMGAQEVFDLGEAIGAATTLKLVGNFLLTSAARSLTEGLSIVEAGGFDVGAAVEMLTRTLVPIPYLSVLRPDDRQQDGDPRRPRHPGKGPRPVHEDRGTTGDAEPSRQPPPEPAARW